MSVPRILFIAPKYFGYYKLIKNEFEKLDYHVDYVPDANDNLMFILSKRNKYLLSNYKKIYCRIIDKYIKKNYYEYIIVIGGKLLSYNEWNKILGQAKTTKKILYQWDSMKNFNYSSFIPLFDRILTFDRKDAEDNNIEYFPLFYPSRSYYENDLKRDIDLLFVGIWHSDRITVLDKISSVCEKQNINYYFRVYYPFLSWLWIRIKKGKEMNSKFLTFRKISLRKMNRLYGRSKCILDIASPNQSGLTMRTIECIGANKKLLTTNANVRHEKFYTENNIAIFDRICPQVDFSFLYKDSIYPHRSEYSIREWVRKLIDYE